MINVPKDCDTATISPFYSDLLFHMITHSPNLVPRFSLVGENPGNEVGIHQELGGGLSREYRDPAPLE